MDAEFVRALPSEDLPTSVLGEPHVRRVDLGSVEVCVARLEEHGVVAFAAVCPHQETNLEAATFWDGKVRCPLHLYLYDPVSGENLIPARDAKPENLWKLKPGYLPIYPAEERDGWIHVSPEAKPPPGAYRPEREQRPPRGQPAVKEAPPEPLDSGPLAHDPSTLAVSAGSEFELRLPTSPRPGFTWRVQVPAGLVSVLEERYDPAGDPPGHRVLLAALVTGEAVVKCLYARPWDTEPAEVREYRVQIS